MFSYEKKEFENTKTINLIENGNNIEVKETNKKEFVKLMTNVKLAKEIESQAKAINQGLTDIIPADMLSILTEKDLGFRLAGVATIDSNHF